jgi:hypothetical protein
LAAAISDGFSAIETLAGECRENYDNFNGREQGEPWGEAADSLEGVSEPDFPETLKVLAELPLETTEQVNKDKRRGPSRAVQLSNAVVLLQAAKDFLEDLPDEHKDLKDEAESLASDLDEAIDLDGSVEFPGMFG